MLKSSDCTSLRKAYSKFRMRNDKVITRRRRRSVLESLETRQLLAGDLYISEYVEGSFSNRALELANTSGGTLDLAASGYSLVRYLNGSNSGQTIPLIGSIAANGVHVIANTNADSAILAVADQTSSDINHSGNDAYELVQTVNGTSTVIDTFGVVGQNPGTGWSSDGVSTVNQTLRRKPTISMGNPAGFNPLSQLSEQWDAFAADTIDGLGVLEGGGAGPSLPEIFLNEVLLDHPGSNSNADQYVELRGPANSTIPVGTFLVNINGNANPTDGAVGDVVNVIDLGGQSFGSNGYLVLVEPNTPYAVDAGASSVVISSGNLQEASSSFSLIFSSVVPSVGDDADANDDGVIDINNWSVIDGIGITDGDLNDQAYGPLQLSGSNVDYLGRDGDSIGQAASDWVISSLSGTLPIWTLNSASPSQFDGEQLDHVGSENFVAPSVSGSFVINEIRTTAQQEDNFDFIELFEVTATNNATTDGLALLQIQNDSLNGNNPGIVQSVLDLSGGLSDANGFVLLSENSLRFRLEPGDRELDSGLISSGDFLLVENFTGNDGDDLDANDDGVIDGLADLTIDLPWTNVLDAVSPVANGSTALNYADDFGGLRIESNTNDTPAGFARSPDGSNSTTILSPTDVSGDTPGSTNNPAVSIVTSIGGPVVTEGQVAGDSISIALTRQPNQDVTFTLTPEDLQFAAAPNSLTFTAANWNQPQPVTLTANDDAIIEGSHSRTLTITSSSGQADFDQIEIAPITVAIRDNDATIPNIALNEVRFDAANSASIDFIEVVDLSSSSGIDLTAVSVIVISDQTDLGRIESAVSLQGIATDAAGISLIAGPDHPTTESLTDIEVDQFDFDGSAKTVLLVTGFSASIGDDLDAADSGNLDYTPWSQILDSVSISGDAGLRRVADATGSFVPLARDDESLDTPGQSNVLPAGVQITVDEGVLSEANPVTIDAHVSLTAAPASNVTATITSNGELLLDDSTSPAVLTFTPTNWFQPQTLTLQAVDDFDNEGDHFGNLTATFVGDPVYAALPPTSQGSQIPIIDNDSDANVVINEFLYGVGDLDANANGVADQNDQFVEVLNFGDDPVDLSGWQITYEENVRHEFESGTVLAAGQAIVVFGGIAPLEKQDFLDNGPPDILVTSSSTGSLNLGNGGTITLASTIQINDVVDYQSDAGVNFNGQTDSVAREFDGDGDFIPHGDSISVFDVRQSAGLQNFDNSGFSFIGPRVVIVETAGETQVSEGDAVGDSFDIRLSEQPLDDVTVNINSGSDLQTDLSVLTFTTNNWSTSQTLTVTAVDDSQVEGFHRGQVDFELDSMDLLFDDLLVTSVGVDITDNDVPNTTNAVINEFVINHIGSEPDTDTFIELFAPGVNAPANLDTLTILEIDGDGTEAGRIEAAIPGAITDSSGYLSITADSNFENGTVTILLVEGFTGSVGDDVDTDNDGLLEPTVPWTAVIDSVAVADFTASDTSTLDRVYSSSVLFQGLDENPMTFGGASRIPDGSDDDLASDWRRNDFAGAGLPSFFGVIADGGEAINTPGATNVLQPLPPDVIFDLGDGILVSEATPTLGDTFNVVLSSEPSSDVAVIFAISDDQTNTDVSLLTFTSNSGPTPWNVPQTVTVTVVDDEIVEGNHTGSISVSVTSTDASYSQLTPEPIQIEIVDNDNTGTIVARHLFYNDSSFDNNDAGANADDDAAIDGSKDALLPGGTATAANFSGYIRGLNGIMVDIANPPATPTLADFDFRVGNDDTPGDWDPLGVTPTIDVRPGAGESGSDRVTIIFPDGAISDQWLQVIVLASGPGGLLATDDVHYWGAAPGDTSDADTGVSVADASLLAANFSGFFDPPSTVDDPLDINKDGTVSVADRSFVIANFDGFFDTPLSLIDLSGGAALVAKVGDDAGGKAKDDLFATTEDFLGLLDHELQG
ncbi:MAG: lamin tail domain-containing protein [Planctomycetota bacterium]